MFQEDEPQTHNHPRPVLLPTSAAEESAVPFLPEQTPFLFCDTFGIYLFGRLDDYNVATLLNGLGEPVG